MFLHCISACRFFIMQGIKNSKCYLYRNCREIIYGAFANDLNMYHNAEYIHV